MHFIQFENTTPEARINIENIFTYYPVVSDEKFIIERSIKRNVGEDTTPTRADKELSIYTTNFQSGLTLMFESREALVDALKILDASIDLISVEYKGNPKEDESILKC